MKQHILPSLLAMVITIGTQAQTLFPSKGAKNVCVDTHLVLTFTEAPKTTNHGMVRVFEVQSGACIDSLDSFLGRGSIFLYRCNLRNDGGPFTWVRNTQGHHGDVFVECTFSTTNGRKVDFGRSPSNKGKTYPHAEQVMISCKTAESIPEGWSAIGEPTTFFAEYNTRDLSTGQPVDTSKRHRYARQLDGKKDKTLIKQYSTPSYVLGGWNPQF